MKNLGVMLDCSRGAVYTESALKKFVDTLGRMGYNSLQLYTEDTLRVDGEPYFGYLRGAYSTDELRRVDAYAKERGIELIPAVQTLAHLKGVTRWREYSDVTDTGNILLMGDERTYELIDNIFAACRKAYSTKRINIGMDEAYLVGRGKYADIHGNSDRMTAMLNHLERVCTLAEKHGFKPMMWSDMFFRIAKLDYYSDKRRELAKDAVARVPKSVDLIYWDYYSSDYAAYDATIKTHKQFNNDIVFAGGAWCWSGITPHNKYSIRNTQSAIKACNANGVDDVIITVWKDDGAESSLFSVLPALFFAAEYYKGSFDETDIKAKFEKLVGIPCDGFLALDMPDLADGDYTNSNPTKYMLFSDLFLGWLDGTVDIAKSDTFDKAKVEIDKYAGNKDYGYIFATASALCNVMSIKYALGVRTRNAYKSRDKQAIKRIVSEYDELYKRVEALYDVFKAQWDRECKLNGFEHHDARYGALLMRIKHCRQILNDYASDKTENIPALDEDILPPHTVDAPLGKTVNFNNWAMTALIKHADD